MAAQINIPPPAPKESRPHKILLSLAPEEKARLAAVAKRRGEPVAVCARVLLLAAVEAAEADQG